MNASNRVCPQCGNASAEAICPVDGWSTVPESLLAERGLVLGSALLGRFRVGALLRHDGAIAVYGGLDERSGHPVHVHLVHVPEGTSLEVVARMQRAAKTLETVRHPALANVLASGMSERGDLAIIAERVTGPTLAEKLRAGPLAPVRTADMGHAIFAGLEVAHAAGVAHHDLTPECIVMPSDDKFVVERIGLFDLLRMSRPANEELAVQPHGMAYGAPEVARDKLVTRQADLYSVGAILYESLTGAPVFDEPTAADRLVAHLTRMPEPPALRGQRLEGPLVELILHCLAKKPWNRPGSATEARVAVENATRGPAAWPIDSEHTPVPRRLLSEPPPLPSFPPVPPPLVTRDAGRPRVDARTRPHLSSASVVVARPKRTLWPWLALAAVLLLCAWPIVASLDRGAPERGGGDQVARERPLPITVHGRAAVDEEKRRADLVRVAAEADAPKAQADADAAKAQAEARAMAQAEAEAAAAKAKAQAEADTARAQAEVDAAKAKAQAEADAAKAQAEAEAAKAKAEADAAKAEADAAKAKALAEADAAKAKALAEADAAKAKAEADAAKAKAEADAAKAKAEADAAKAKAATNAPKPGKSWRERQAELEAEAKAEEARMAALERKKARAEAERKAQLSRARAVAEAPRDPGGDATPDRSETPPAAAFRRAAVMSVPAGATVTVDGAVVGQTPTVLTWAPGGQGRAIVSLDGYEPRSFDLSEGANGKTVLFELVRKKK